MLHERVQIPAYADRWMMGDRHGEIVKITRSKVPHNGQDHPEIAHVKLDISGKTMRYLLDDCTVV
jgi:hypothetical protein